MVLATEYQSEFSRIRFASGERPAFRSRPTDIPQRRLVATKAVEATESPTELNPAITGIDKAEPPAKATDRTTPPQSIDAFLGSAPTVDVTLVWCDTVLTCPAEAAIPMDIF